QMSRKPIGEDVTPSAGESPSDALARAIPRRQEDSCSHEGWRRNIDSRRFAPEPGWVRSNASANMASTELSECCQVVIRAMGRDSPRGLRLSATQGSSARVRLAIRRQSRLVPLQCRLFGK